MYNIPIFLISPGHICHLLIVFCQYVWSIIHKLSIKTILDNAIYFIKIAKCSQNHNINVKKCYFYHDKNLEKGIGFVFNNLYFCCEKLRSKFTRHYLPNILLHTQYWEGPLTKFIWNDSFVIAHFKNHL